MPYRREDESNRTDRPAELTATSAADAGLPTVREILALDAVAGGVPEVLVGGAALDARVRWLHVSDSAGVARLLNGGELLLSTGSGWPAEPDELRAFIGALVEAGIAGLVLELGSHYRYVPAVVVRAATDHGLALAALHREVKFVALTEAVHRRIISEQTVALHARDEVRERFTALALRGAPADHIVQQLAQTLGAPVVLENLAHEVVAADLPPDAEEEVLGGWQLRSRDAHRRAALGAAGADRWLIVPVEARGIRWGHLIALPGPAHPAGRTSVLEQGAIALALGRLADGEDDTWARIGRQRLVEHLLTGRFGSAGGAAARLAAAGLELTGTDLYGLVATGRTREGAADDAARRLGGRALEGRPSSGEAPASARIALLSLPAGTRFDDAAAEGFAASIAAGAGAGAGVGATADGAGVALAIGSMAHDLDGLLVSVQEALDLARTPPARPSRGVLVRRSQDRPLVRLVTSLRDDHRLQELGERMLAPLIEYDLARGGDLLDVLGAMLAHPGNRTAAAQASHLSRSVFYQRLALIGDLLGADLDDGETLTALHLALLVRRSGGR
ncbi:PucR family transcriptional regulator ligand-binding domain-containing protein [Agromyces aurantiacus]|uniref:PucR family transcriptional regulator ligand-binding domain-containing protein n=1 Tax=Agromyces aurantiacus TaxID=165814 RepID=A0ABV9R587_9MICO|nr:PucR family transcriptional regulator [Agromyces aurantiacus]MBM7503399.1 purine catabolism regulator [Agromyces aurantiacus]